MNTAQGSASVEADATAATGRRSRRPSSRCFAVATALLVILVAAGFGWAGRPRLGEGSMIALGAGMTWANDGFENTRMVVRGKPVATVSAKFSIRNEGHVAFTIYGLDNAETGTWLSTQAVTFAPGISGDDENVTPSEQVTVRPGDEATVFWSLDLGCQPPLASIVTIEVLRFRVSWLGIPTARELRLAQPITFVGDSGSGPLPGVHCADS